jgi:hypothetical protein
LESKAHFKGKSTFFFGGEEVEAQVKTVFENKAYTYQIFAADVTKSGSAPDFRTLWINILADLMTKQPKAPKEEQDVLNIARKYLQGKVIIDGFSVDSIAPMVAMRKTGVQTYTVSYKLEENDRSFVFGKMRIMKEGTNTDNTLRILVESAPYAATPIDETFTDIQSFSNFLRDPEGLYGRLNEMYRSIIKEILKEKYE